MITRNFSVHLNVPLILALYTDNETMRLCEHHTLCQKCLDNRLELLIPKLSNTQLSLEIKETMKPICDLCKYDFNGKKLTRQEILDELSKHSGSPPLVEIIAEPLPLPPKPSWLQRFINVVKGNKS